MWAPDTSTAKVLICFISGMVRGWNTWETFRVASPRGRQCTSVAKKKIQPKRFISERKTSSHFHGSSLQQIQDRCCSDSQAGKYQSNPGIPLTTCTIAQVCRHIFREIIYEKNFLSLAHEHTYNVTRQTKIPVFGILKKLYLCLNIWTWISCLHFPMPLYFKDLSNKDFVLNSCWFLLVQHSWEIEHFG